MKLTKLGCFLVLLLVLTTTTTFAQDDTSTMTIADIITAKAAQAEPEFTMLLDALEKADDEVMETLMNSEEEYTFFAPIDAPFQELLTDMGEEYYFHFTNNAIMTPSMNNHIVSGSNEPDDVASYMRLGEMNLTSLDGGTIRLEPDADGNITVNGFALVGEPIEAQNGIIYVIDGLLLPPVWQNLAEQTIRDYQASSESEAAPTETAPEPAAPLPSEPIRQWARKANATSEYSNPNWSAMQATGAPNTQSCGDHDSAWASAGATSQETLSLEFAVPVIPSQVNIHQTYNPGSIVRVELVNTRTEKVIAIPDSADPPKNTPCPGVFTLDISGVDMPVNGVRIHLDQSIGGDWNEIDAVELVGIPTEAPPPDEVVMDSGINVTCDTGANITNGTKVTVIQMRSGYTYTATAIGINGFDPVLAVLDESGHGLCNDDDKTASLYNANLPTTGFVDAMSDSARVHFAQNSGGSFEDVSLIVGGYEQSGGEFLLVLEGMAVTRADEEGDPFSVMITPAMRAANVPVTVYMLANTTALDPYIAAVDETVSYYMEDGAGNMIACDDAGDPGLCWGVSDKLSGYFFTNATDRSIPGGQVDAMLTIPVAELGAGVEKMTLLMTSSENRSFGEYTLIFHIGLGQ